MTYGRKKIEHIKQGDEDDDLEVQEDQNQEEAKKEEESPENSRKSPFKNKSSFKFSGASPSFRMTHASRPNQFKSEVSSVLDSHMRATSEVTNLKLKESSSGTLGQSKQGKDAPVIRSFIPHDFPSPEDRLLKERDHRMIWYPRVRNTGPTGFSVDVKEGRTCVLVNNICYLYGGYSPCYTSINFEAFNIRLNQMVEIVPRKRDPQPRAFHTCNVYNNDLIIFGGETFARYADSRLVTNELLIFETLKQEFKVFNFVAQTERRKHHAACIFAGHLVVSGGIDEENRIIQNIDTFNIQNIDVRGWRKAPHNIGWAGRANHTMTDIYLNPPSRLITIQTKPKPLIPGMPSEQKKVAFEGLYIFGGKEPNGKYPDKLIIVNTSVDPWVPYDIEPVGNGPTSRCDHCAHYLPSQNFFVIYGGSDMHSFETTGKSAQGSVHVLELTYLVWTTVKIMKCEPVSRYGFCSFAIGRPRVKCRKQDLCLRWNQ